jgi:hypothetical protein
MAENCFTVNTAKNCNEILLLDFSNPVKVILITRSVKVYVFLPSPFPSFNKCYKEFLIFNDTEKYSKTWSI